MAASIRPRHIGRGNSTPSSRARDCSIASIRPRHIGRGNPQQATPGHAADKASIRPRHIGRGNPTLGIGPGMLHIASIRPRHIGRGNRPRESSRGRCTPASIRPRHIGRGNLAAVASVVGVVPWLQFGHGTSAVETAASAGASGEGWDRFNSATAHRPWKRSGRQPIARPLQASIRPRHIGRGNLMKIDPDRADFALASIRPRHIGRGNQRQDGQDAGRRELQFGHGTSAVETRFDLLFDGWLALASIRPRHIGRGNTGEVAAHQGGRSGFNSATAHRPWKPRVCHRGAHPGTGFNSATAHRPWKPCGSRAAVCTPTSLQFGHGTSAVETRPRVHSPRDG